MAFSVTTLVLCLSIGTTYASHNSLPGDILYPIKTSIREPLLKLTKITTQEKEDFDLSLADERIHEVELLIKKDKLNEENADANFTLFEKHLEENKKDSEDTQTERVQVDVNAPTLEKAQAPATPQNDEKRNEEKVNKRIEKYRELIKSRPALNNFYELRAKGRLEHKVKQEENVDDLESQNNTKAETEKAEEPKSDSDENIKEEVNLKEYNESKTENNEDIKASPELDIDLHSSTEIIKGRIRTPRLPIKGL